MRSRGKTILFLVIIVSAVVWMWLPPRTSILDLSESTEVQDSYLAEFQAWDQKYVAEYHVAPDQSASFSWDDHGGVWLVGCDSCHTLRVTDASGHSQAVLTAVEGDPCSGRSFDAMWSRDSKALFIKGWYSGLGCHWVKPGRTSDLSFIYTLKDRVLWEVVSTTPRI